MYFSFKNSIFLIPVLDWLRLYFSFVSANHSSFLEIMCCTELLPYKYVSPCLLIMAHVISGKSIRVLMIQPNTLQ